MKFIIIFGPPAVGKMTVAFELAKLTQYRVFHNHMTIDLVHNFFDFDNPTLWTLTDEFRKRIFEEVSKSSLPGIIFTYVWALDDPADKKFVDESAEIFRNAGGEVYFIELEANQSERLKRNRTELRLHNKPTKRDLERSEKNLLQSDQTCQLNSRGDFFYKENYLKIENSDLTPVEVAKRIVSECGWQ